MQPARYRADADVTSIDDVEILTDGGGIEKARDDRPTFDFHECRSDSGVAEVVSGTIAQPARPTTLAADGNTIDEDGATILAPGEFTALGRLDATLDEVSTTAARRSQAEDAASGQPGSEPAPASQATALDGPQHWTDAGWKRWFAHAKYKVARPSPKKRISRPLYPDMVRIKDADKVLKAVGWFLYKYGFWPQTAEVTATLRADKGGVVQYLDELVEERLVETAFTGPGKNRIWQLTADGWAAIGLEPIEPWQIHPRFRLAKVARMVATALYDAERQANALSDDPA